MRLALSVAGRALLACDVPIGAVVLDPSGQVIGEGFNRREADADPTAHAEVLALRAAAQHIGQWRLEGCTLVVTLEPCAMCAMAAVWARVDRIAYGAADPKAGAAWSLFNIPQDERLNHYCELEAGVREEACAAVLEEFFRSRRP